MSSTPPEIQTAGIDSPEEMIRRVDQIVTYMFDKLQQAMPCVTIIDKAGAVYGMDVLYLFQAIDPADAARKKMSLGPIVREYIASKKLDVRGYVFVVQGWVADREDARTANQLKQGIPIAKLRNRVNVVLYCCEYVSEPDGILTFAYGEREIQASPRQLLDLDVRTLERPPKRVGFGILSESLERRRTDA